MESVEVDSKMPAVITTYRSFSRPTVDNLLTTFKNKFCQFNHLQFFVKLKHRLNKKFRFKVSCAKYYCSTNRLIKHAVRH